DVAEVHSAVVMIECRRTLYRSNEDVWEPVPIDVSQRYSGADEQVAIGERVFIADDVRVRDPGTRRLEHREAGMAASCDRQGAPAKPPLLVPRCIGRAAACRENGEQEQRAAPVVGARSEEHTSELQSLAYLV